MHVDDRVGLAPAELAELTRQTARLATLQQVLRWGFALTPPLALVEIVVQDEFTHDVVMAWPGAGGAPDRHLVFDSTGLGAIDAVSVWDRRPTADELLDARTVAGWRPTPTSTVDGDRILGHACKLAAST